jgi:hypothetical protein
MIKKLLSYTLLFIGGAAIAEVPGAIMSDNGLYQVVVVNDLSKAPLNEFVSIGAKVFGRDDQLIDGAVVTVNGGMPSHGHGLPTSPEAAETCGGSYLIEGLKFTMPGHWVIILDIVAQDGPDRVKVEFEL